MLLPPLLQLRQASKFGQILIDVKRCKSFLPENLRLPPYAMMYATIRHNMASCILGGQLSTPGRDEPAGAFGRSRFEGSALRYTLHATW